MLKLKKAPEKDFVLLNLTDTQLRDSEWEEGGNCRFLLHTVKTLVERTRPDLITLSGDLAWAGQDESYDKLADLLDSLGIPWAPVWGNHDNQMGAEYIETVVGRYLTHPCCLYERGPAELGNGNYVIAITEGDKIVSAVIMMDTHDKIPFEANKNGKSWASLTEEQLDWYREQIRALSATGCSDTVLIMHIPCYAYRAATAAAYKADLDLKQMTLEQAEGKAVWNDGYEDSVGVQYEGIGCISYDDGVFETLAEQGSTKHVITGHDHVNNWIINYKGIKLVYALKCGCGCYWNPILNGGTVLKIGSQGVRDIKHEYVDISHLL